jgi:hypothetical protein
MIQVFWFKGHAARAAIFFDCLTLDDESTMMLRNVGNHSLNDTP